MSEDTGRFDITSLRVLLIADVLARTAELRGLQVFTALTSTAQSPELAAALERDAHALGIHPPANSRNAQTSLGGPVDVHVVRDGAAMEPSHSGLAVTICAAHMRRALGGDSNGPFTVRLALMSFPYYQPADLTEGLLASARKTLGDWRHRVAEWAESPSGPIPVRIMQEAQAAFGDLETVPVLALLRSLAPDANVPAGAKFETFVYADRILGLELARHVGQPAG